MAIDDPVTRSSVRYSLPVKKSAISLAALTTHDEQNQSLALGERATTFLECKAFHFFTRVLRATREHVDNSFERLL